MRQDQSEQTLLTGTRRPGGSFGAPTALVVTALGLVYVVWGSTYLGIRITVQDLPPLASASWRFLAAGVLLGIVVAVLKGWRTLRVSRAELVGCSIVGLLLPALGNGLVVVAEHRGAPSGVAALLVAAVPLWVVVYRSATGDRPNRRTLLGVATGFAGLVVLVTAAGVGGDVEVAACLIVVVASVFWSFGSWATPRITLPANPFVMAVYEMLSGGGVLALLAVASGESVLPSAAPADSWLAWSYLVVFGSVVGFTSYVWVLGVAPVSLVATYAYVNPVVAVFLGWLVLSEPVTWAIVVGGTIVLASVALVIAAERRPARRTATDDPPAATPPVAEPEPSRTS
jgi:drug/metabolite transporter (DMT)-like permease